MKMTFRWYGDDDDTITMQQIRQIPACSGLMGYIPHVPGEVWPLEAIQEFIARANASGLEVEIIESVNVHEDIKLGFPTRDQYIENYKETIRNLAKCGIKVVIYNFMPVFDWLRTDWWHEIEDGSKVLYYDEADLKGMTPMQIVENAMKSSQGFTLPGWEPERLKELEQALENYKGVTQDQLRENYKYFLERVVPVCEEVGIKLAVHPDDPAWPLFDLPRVVHSKEDLEKIVAMVDSPSNGICLCTGSMGSSPSNDMPEIIRQFGGMGRIPCAHVRNVKYLGERKFRESSHLSADGDLDMFEIMKAFYETGFDGYIRPDHGRMIWDEQGRPGCGLYDRALGIAYLNGIWESLEKMNPQK